MALDLENEYPGQVIAASAGYPWGSFKNETTPGLFDGTPFEKAWPNDWLALFQGLLNAAGITPTGSADTVLASQHLQGLLYQSQTADFFVDSGTADAYVLSPLTNNYAPHAYKDGQRIRFVPDNTNTGASTVNVSALGLKDIYYKGSTLAAGALTAGDRVTIEYDLAAARFNLISSDALTGLSPAVRDIARGLVVRNNVTNPNYQVDVDADEIVLQNSAGAALKFNAVNLTADITASGANGLDTGVEASNTWYFVWAIGKADGTLASLLSLSPTAPTMPAGYTYRALLGAIYNDGSSNFIRIVQEGDTVRRTNATALSGGVATTLTAINTSAIVPLTAKRVFGYMAVVATGAGGNLIVSDVNSLNEILLRNSTAGQSDYTYFENVKDLYYLVSGAGAAGSLNISGWKY